MRAAIEKAAEEVEVGDVIREGAESREVSEIDRLLDVDHLVPWDDAGNGLAVRGDELLEALEDDREEQ